MNKLVKEIGVILDYGDKYHEVHINMEEITRKRRFTQEKIDKAIKYINLLLECNLEYYIRESLISIKDVLEEEIL